ncbi:MAG: hypothetical protein QXN16_03550, partial [Candidatus Micrarchaeaceae archaeon]
MVFGYTDADTVEGALLLHLLSQKGEAATGNPLVRAIPYLSKSLYESEFKYGIYLGKMLFGIYAKGGIKYKVNPLLGLQDFFEPLGYEIVYETFNSKPAIRAYGEKLDLGFNAHVLESGMMSGYVSAATGRYLMFHEVECAFNNLDSCFFLPGRSKEFAQLPIEQLPKLALKTFSAKPSKPSKHYDQFLWHIAMNASYKDEMQTIMN